MVNPEVVLAREVASPASGRTAKAHTILTLKA